MSEIQTIAIDPIQAQRIGSATSPGLKRNVLPAWYCDQCHVAVRQLHCQHCGKLESDAA